MKYHKFFIVILTCNIHQNLSGVLTMSQYKPDSYFQQPYFTQDYFTDINFIFSGGFANSAYTNDSQKVAFLQQFGTEDLLKRFVDTSLSANNIESLGQGLLTGNFHVQELIVSCYKNITKGFFIEGATVIQDLSITSINIDYVPSTTKLTHEQIIYLEKLQQKIPKTIDQSGMFTTALYAGYHQSFSHFKHLDFIDLQIKLGMTSPQAMHTNNHSFMQLPFVQNINFGYPIIATTSFGLLDWMTLGCNSALILWQAGQATIPINNTFSQNNLLLTESCRAKVLRGPLFTTSIYFQADHVYQGFSTLIAYCYTRNSNYTIHPTNTYNIQTNLINQSPLLQAWSLGSIYLQCDLDFATQITPRAPVISLLCNIPIKGQLCPETNIFGGSCSLQINYQF